MSKLKFKVLIVVEGGVIQNVLTSGEAEVVIVDYDEPAGNMIRDFPHQEIEIEDFFKQITEDTPAEKEVRDELKQRKF